MTLTSDRAPKSRLALAAMLTAVGCAVLVGLGVWQWQRMIWKAGLLESIEARVAAAPVTIDEAIARYGAGDAEYLRVAVDGRYRHDAELYFYAPHPRFGPGVHIITPLEIGPHRFVLVNRGYVPERLQARTARPESLPLAPVTVRGLLRGPEQVGWFSPQNDAVRNLWFTRDPNAMADAVRRSPNDIGLPFILDAEREPQGPDWPQGGVTRRDIPNRHFEYALTWFGLAATLIGVFTAFVLSRRNES